MVVMDSIPFNTTPDNPNPSPNPTPNPMGTTLGIPYDLSTLVMILQRGEQCWCDMAIGSPMQTGHTAVCQTVRNALLQPTPKSLSRQGYTVPSLDDIRAYLRQHRRDQIPVLLQTRDRQDVWWVTVPFTLMLPEILTWGARVFIPCGYHQRGETCYSPSVVMAMVPGEVMKMDGDAYFIYTEGVMYYTDADPANQLNTHWPLTHRSPELPTALHLSHSQSHYSPKPKVQPQSQPQPTTQPQTLTGHRGIPSSARAMGQVDLTADERGEGKDKPKPKP